ncbi:MAG: DNA polymerase II large subunit [Nanoarchaeota archaeon]|nr:DNA polymerase II large subunit [Nanoarchaeota archaeon]
MNSQMDKYFEDIENNVNELYVIAGKSRAKGFDPDLAPEIPKAKNMAERVVGLISTVSPQIVNTPIPQRIQELEKQYGTLDWRVAFTIAEEIAKEKFCKFKDKKEAMEIGIRVGFAYITLGTVASPLEGFAGINIRKRADGKEYFALQYSGPIRSAGGTGASVSVLIADYIRKKFGYDKYDPNEKEVKRTSTELYDYHERITNLQYLPSVEEVEYMAQNIPVQIDGDPSEDIEVSNHKDLPRIETNRIRNGFCLVMGECLSQKAPKIWKQLSKWGKDFDMGEWDFIEEFLKIQKKAKSKGGDKKQETGITPNYTFIKDLVAGRPVLTHPLAVGGFRLRYGRARTTGYSASAIHPATTYITRKFIGLGTQLKLERPGKAASMTTCDTIDGPIVKLLDGSVVRVDTVAKAKEIVADVDQILFLGDILFNYGDFFNRAHPLVPAGYCEEIWVQELRQAGGKCENPLKVSAAEAISFSEQYNIPLHPRYTYYWKTFNTQEISSLIDSLDKGKESEGKLVIPLDETTKHVLEFAGVPHLVANKEFIVLGRSETTILKKIFCDKAKEVILDPINQEISALELINKFSPIKIMDKGGTFIGARMGRPEKAKMRKLAGSPHVLFPIGEEGGKLRSFQSALEKGKITSDFAAFKCSKCGKKTVFSICEDCGVKAERIHFCKICGELKKDECQHGPGRPYTNLEIDIKTLFGTLLKNMGLNVYPDLIKGVKGTSNKEHIAEHLSKGILRAMHEVNVNKDGTTRYDMTQLPITHFKPKEVGTDIEKLKSLGYLQDYKGKDLVDENQILELRPQDVILPACLDSPDEGADFVLERTAHFVDDMLQKLYGLDPYYKLDSKKDLVWHLVLALAPHTSAGIVGRIVGFSKTQGFFAHPMLHAATRRDCDGDEASVSLLLDCLINFSRRYLPSSRGSTQDAPLVLTYKLVPSEVDDMFFDIDRAFEYPLELYKAGEEYKQPWDIKIDQAINHLNTPEEYFGYGFTHDTDDINAGVRCSSYKTLPSMQEKLTEQMRLADQIRAVDASDVARLVIERHFLPDTKGNLRKFSQQQFRCVQCNEKYRRPPLIGKCIKCGGKILFTISEGSIVKYLEPAISLAEKYNLPSYLKQTLELTQRRVEGVFGKEKEKQVGLGKWF